MKKLLALFFIVLLSGCSIPSNTTMTDLEIKQQVLENYRQTSSLSGESIAIKGIQQSAYFLNSTKLVIDNGVVNGVSTTIGEFGEDTEENITFNVGETYEKSESESFEVYTHINMPLELEINSFAIEPIDETKSKLVYLSKTQNVPGTDFVSDLTKVEMTFDSTTFEVTAVLVEHRTITSPEKEISSTLFESFLSVEFLAIDNTKSLGQFTSTLGSTPELSGRHTFNITRVNLEK